MREYETRYCDELEQIRLINRRTMISITVEDITDTTE
jgi:hypothetical protein